MSARESNFTRFEIQESKDNGKTVDIREGIASFSYYENILSNFITATVSVIESTTRTGSDRSGQTEGLLNYLPVRGGEEVRMVAKDSFGNLIDFSKHELYVNTVSVPNADATLSSIEFGLVSKEYFSNEKTRVVKRYEGKVSETVKKVLDETLKTKHYKSENIEETSNAYAFIGNDRKPFYTCSWLGTKSIPAKDYGKTAGFLFYQTQDGFCFKSVDGLLTNKSKGIYRFTDSVATLPKGEKKILSYDVNKNIDVQTDMMLGVYYNRTIYFDPYAFKVDVKTYDITKQKNIAHSGKPSGFDFVNKQFTDSPTRLMSTILDVGTLPIGKDATSQLEYWKSDKARTNDKVIERMVQSIMRYNQLFTIKASITVEGDFSLRAGDVIECVFPSRKGLGTAPEKDKTTSEKYTIATLCHYITPERCLTRLGLVRDSFAK